MQNKNKKPILFIVLLLIVGFAIGATIAYYTSSDTFNNEFNTSNYVMEVQETFQSPDDWTPGTTTPKEVIATNRGDTVAAVRVKLTPSWETDSGGTLPLNDGTNEAAIINYSFDKDYKWIKEGDWYYYIRPIDKDESTSSIIESVTFNPNVDISATHNCVTDPETHATTCTTETGGYGSATYKLRVDIETCQYDQYKNVWSTNVDITRPTTLAGTLRKNGVVNEYGTTYDTSNTFGKQYLYQSSIESIMILDVIKVPDNAIDSWDCSEEQNESIMCWYTNKDNDYYYELYIGQEGGVKANPNSGNEFSNFTEATYLNMKYLDTSNVTNMTEMFYYTGYTNKPKFEIKGLETWDVSKVESMNSMFRFAGRACQGWTIGDLSSWNTSSVKDMSKMFDRAAYASNSFDIGNIGNWNVSNVENMASMFEFAGSNAKYFNIGTLDNWDTRKVTNMRSMFADAGYIASTWNNIGTIKVYADSIEGFMSENLHAKATINIYRNPTNYNYAFSSAARVEGSGITVNYTSDVIDIDNIVATKSSDSNVVKGSLLN